MQRDAQYSVDDDDEDAPPEDLSFAAAKSDALLDRQAESSSANRIRDVARNKRRQREAFLAEQQSKKKIRLEQLSATKLSDDVLDKVSNDSVVGSIPAAAAVVERRPSTKCVRQKPSRQTFFVVPDSVKDTTEDFLPLESKSTEFHVRVVAKDDGKVGGIVANAQSLLLLKNKLIFGRRRTRETPTEAMSKKGKQAATGLDVLPITSRRR